MAISETKGQGWRAIPTLKREWNTAKLRKQNAWDKITSCHAWCSTYCRRFSSCSCRTVGSTGTFWPRRNVLPISQHTQSVLLIALRYAGHVTCCPLVSDWVCQRKDRRTEAKTFTLHFFDRRGQCNTLSALFNDLTIVYTLRSRQHDKNLLPKTSDLNDRHFLIRLLYEDCCSVTLAYRSNPRFILHRVTDCSLVAFVNF